MAEPCSEMAHSPKKMAELESGMAAPAPEMAHSPKKMAELEKGNQARDVKVAEDPEAGKLTFLQAVSMNILNMFGTGPLITIPYCIASVDPMGPHAIWGYGVACIACCCDSLVWGEIGSMWPKSGGPFVYLKELYGRDTWGRLISFMFVWQFFISGPAEAASGFIAIAEYLTYFTPDTVNYGYRVLISYIMIFVCAFLMLRRMTDIGTAANVLSGITVIAMLYTLIAGFSYWDAANLETPKEAWSTGHNSLWIIALASRFGIYDMTGYYDVCFMGGEVRNPKRTIPLSCICTCCCVAVVYLLVYLSVVGSMPWSSYIEMYTDDFDGVPLGIMSLFTEWRTGSTVFAQIVTLVVAITIFGSTFAMLVGFVYIPPEAAREGYFFEIFAPKEDSAGKNKLPIVSLVFIFVLTMIFSLFSMGFVIDAMTTMIVLVMFCGQSLGLIIYRYTTPKEEQAEGWRMPLFPLPCIIQFIIFMFVFITTDNSSWEGADPILETSIGFLALGVVMFLARSKYNKQWPFAPLEATSGPEGGDASLDLDEGVDNSPIAKLATSPTAYLAVVADPQETLEQRTPKTLEGLKNESADSVDNDQVQVQV